MHTKIHKADSTLKDILRMAIRKFKQEDRNFPASESHSLVYPDGKSLYTPGSEAPPMLPDRKTAFSIQQYRWWKKTAYDRLKLFLVKTGNFQLIFASCSFFLQVVTFFLHFSCKCRLPRKSCNSFLQVSTCKKKLPFFSASLDLQENVATFFLQVSTCKKKLSTLSCKLPTFLASVDFQEKFATFFCKSRLARKSCPLFSASFDLQEKVSTSSCKLPTFSCKCRLAKNSCK